MTEQAQQRRRQQRDQARNEQADRNDLRNRELDDDVACCLEEIDEVLDAEKREREQAEQEFYAFDITVTEKQLNLWQARYAHLGLSYGWCCGMPRLFKNGNKDR